jgi:hypothetical protein
MAFSPDSGNGAGGHDAPLFIEDESAAGAGRGRRRGLVVAGACVLCLAAVGLPVALVVASGGPAPTPAPAVHQEGSSAAKTTVLSALSATTDSGSFNMTYEYSGLSAPTTTTTTASCPPPAAQGSEAVVQPGNGVSVVVPAQQTQNCVLSVGSAASGQRITGQGTIDTDPYAIVASSVVPGLGDITLRANANDVWEIGGGDYGLSPGSQTNGPGSPLSGFASLVEGTLGDREGALAMLGLANPTGYLNLEQQKVTAADFIGTGTVDGVAVNEYKVMTNPAVQPDLPGLSSEQAKTISDAQAVLAKNGIEGSTLVISIDASGYIRQSTTTSTFSDGSSSFSEATFSDFGCAGTVLMPGQTGSGTPPAGCVSPDTGLAPTTTTTLPATTSTTSGAGNAVVPAPTTTTSPAVTSTTSTGVTTTTTTTTTTSSTSSTTSTTKGP